MLCFPNLLLIWTTWSTCLKCRFLGLSWRVLLSKYRMLVLDNWLLTIKAERYEILFPGHAFPVHTSSYSFVTVCPFQAWSIRKIQYSWSFPTPRPSYREGPFKSVIRGTVWDEGRWQLLHSNLRPGLRRTNQERVLYSLHLCEMKWHNPVL